MAQNLYAVFGMRDANRWSKMPHRVLAVWAIVSALSGPLLSAYHFLASIGRVPEATEHAGALTILANISILTFGVSAIGGFLSLLFVGIATPADRSWITILQAIIVALIGLDGVAFGNKYWRIEGVVLLVGAFGSLTPLGKWIDKRAGEIAGGFMIAFVVMFLFRSDWIQDLWTMYTGQKNLRLIPLSEMTTGNWLLALLGAFIYVLAFYEFQQWRTAGKWFQEIKDRLHGDA